MRTMRMTFLWLLILSTNVAHAALPVCTEAPTFVIGKGVEAYDFHRLPEKTLVARSVDIWAANTDRGMKLLGQHNFKSMKSAVRCSKAPFQGSMNLTALVPTLLDLSRDKHWGDSLWQMQLLTESKRAGVWAQKSRLAPKEEAKKIMQKGSWRTLESGVYELIYEQHDKDSHLVLRVVYDVMNP